MGVERVIVSSRSMSDCVYSDVYMDNLGCTECAILFLNIQKKSRDVTVCVLQYCRRLGFTFSMFDRYKLKGKEALS